MPVLGFWGFWFDFGVLVGKRGTARVVGVFGVWERALAENTEKKNCIEIENYVDFAENFSISIQYGEQEKGRKGGVEKLKNNEVLLLLLLNSF